MTNAGTLVLDEFAYIKDEPQKAWLFTVPGDNQPAAVNTRFSVRIESTPEGNRWPTRSL